MDHEHIEVGAWKKIDEVPFDFERRRVSVLIDNGVTRWLVVKGAPDEILGLCTHYEAEDATMRRLVDETAVAATRDQYQRTGEGRLSGARYRLAPSPARPSTRVRER